MMMMRQRLFLIVTAYWCILSATGNSVSISSIPFHLCQITIVISHHSHYMYPSLLHSPFECAQYNSYPLTSLNFLDFACFLHFFSAHWFFFVAVFFNSVVNFCVAVI